MCVVLRRTSQSHDSRANWQIRMYTMITAPATFEASVGSSAGLCHLALLFNHVLPFLLLHYICCMHEGKCMANARHCVAATAMVEPVSHKILSRCSTTRCTVCQRKQTTVSPGKGCYLYHFFIAACQCMLRHLMESTSLGHCMPS